nr:MULTISPECIES: replication initiator protein A [unclassified Coprococcus]
MTDFLTADTNLPSYMMFPRFLLDMEINETAKMLYIILLDRARLSQKSEGWSDTDGHVFIYFTIEADRCEINRQIRADNKMLRELKAKVAKLAEAVEKSIPIIAETLEAIRNHMIFTQYHLLHNEMQKEVIHDWMNHFNPILNKYNTVKKELKAKVTERK